MFVYLLLVLLVLTTWKQNKASIVEFQVLLSTCCFSNFYFPAFLLWVLMSSNEFSYILTSFKCYCWFFIKHITEFMTYSSNLLIFAYDLWYVWNCMLTLVVCFSGFYCLCLKSKCICRFSPSSSHSPGLFRNIREFGAANTVQLFVAINGNFSGLIFFGTSHSKGELPKPLFDKCSHMFTCIPLK